MSENAYIKHGFDLQWFLQDYWQKKPCLIRQFSPDFIDPLDEHDLAGLAQEPEVDSRVISHQTNGSYQRVGSHQTKGSDQKTDSYEKADSNTVWELTQGPIDDFEPLCKGAWTLLVQGVERYISEVDALAEQVKHIGHWRMDDVMVSFSNTNGGVGPHLDQYDVFIVQGKGQRRWQVGLPGTYESIQPHALLSQITGFSPVIDEVLQSGDAIYIPPKHPHNGVALSDCLNYSIGFRAPTDVELLHGLIDEGEAMQVSQERYADPEIYQYRGQSTVAAEVTEHELTQLKANMIALLQSNQAEHALMRYLSRQNLPDMRTELENEGDHEPAYVIDSVIDYIQQGGTFILAAGVKPIYTEQTRQVFTFFIDGQAFETPTELRSAIEQIIHNKAEAKELINTLTEPQQQAFVGVLTDLLNQGYLECCDI